MHENSLNNYHCNHYSQMVGLYVDPEGKQIRTRGLSYTNEQITSDLISEDDAMKGLRLRITELERTLQQYKVTWLVYIIALLHHNTCTYIQNILAGNLTL